jgi:hypothetical protein
MSAPERELEVWFESFGPRIGWFGSYLPTTARGLYVVMGHIGFISAWALPVALLYQFRVLSDAWTIALGFPVLMGGLVSLLRTASRHSAPYRWGRQATRHDGTE